METLHNTIYKNSDTEVGKMLTNIKTNIYGYNSVQEKQKPLSNSSIQITKHISKWMDFNSQPNIQKNRAHIKIGEFHFPTRNHTIQSNHLQIYIYKQPWIYIFKYI